jgi:hypothetical protein
MTKIHFADLPMFVQLASVAVYFLGWVTFAELVIDRHGFDKHLPLYRVGNFCVYDAVVIVALAATWLGFRQR